MKYIKFLGLILIGTVVMVIINELIGVNDALSRLPQWARVTHVIAQTMWGGILGLYFVFRMM